MKIAAALAAGFLLVLPVAAQTAPEPAPAAAPDAPAVDTGVVAPAAIPDVAITHFAGQFQGPTKIVEGAGAGSSADERQSQVLISPAGDGGFTLQWSTLFIDNENTGEMKVKDSTTIEFAPGASPSVFVGKDNGAIFNGRPIYWAKIKGNTLHVQAIIVKEDGTYDVTHYARTVDGNTMRLDFTRFEDGEQTRRVQGDLTKTSN
jgi:hypothetical protein